MPEIKFKAAFDFGQEVYVITDTYQYKRIVASITKHWNGGITYEVHLGADSDEFQAMELSDKRDLGMIPKDNEE